MANKKEIKQYEFRKLVSKDLFLMTRLVKKIGLDKIADCFDNDGVAKMFQKGADEMKIGMNIVLNIAQVVIEALDRIQDEIYDLLEATSNLERKQIEGMDIDVFIDMVYDFFQMESVQKLFHKVVSSLK